VHCNAGKMHRSVQKGISCLCQLGWIEMFWFLSCAMPYQATCTNSYTVADVSTESVLHQCITTLKEYARWDIYVAMPRKERRSEQPNERGGRSWMDKCLFVLYFYSFLYSFLDDRLSEWALQTAPLYLCRTDVLRENGEEKIAAWYTAAWQWWRVPHGPKRQQ